MLMDAAELANINVIQLVHENTAAALMYGIDRMDTEKDLNVLIYNMGGRDAEVSVIRYSAVTDAKNKTYEYVEVLGEGYDATLGGKFFDDILVRIMADKFNGMKERQGKADIRTNQRAMKRLYKEAVSIKDILSANKAVNIKVPEVADYVTLAFELTRETYEQECAHLIDRVKAPIEKALEQAGLTSADIDQVEILGGQIRMPKIQAILKETMDDKELHVHLNGDEAMSFGSAFMAANSTNSFKVRKVYLTQHPKYDVRVNIRPADAEKAAEKAEKQTEAAESEDDGIVYEKDTVLYKRSDYLGQKKTIHLYYDVSMRIEATAVYPCGHEEPLATWDLDIAKLIEDNDVLRREKVTRPKVSLAFELSRSHLFLLNSAKVNVEETVLEEVIKEKEEEPKKEDEKEDEEAATEASSDADSAEPEAEKKPEEAEGDEKAADEGSEAEPEAAKEGEEAAEKAAEEAAEEAEEEEKEYTEKIVPHAFNIDDLGEQLPGLRLMTKKMKKEGKDRIKALDQRDKDKIKTDEAKNKYESLIYSLRDWLRDDDNEQYVPEADREALLKKLEDGEEWLYDEGSSASYTKYQERSYELTKEQTKLTKRKTEHKSREEQIPRLQQALEESRTRAHEIREKMPWISEQEQSDLVAKIEETRDWLDKKLEAQAKLSLIDEPAFTIDDVEKEMAKMNKLAKKIFGKRKPKEPKKPKEEKKEEEKKDEEKKEEEAKEAEGEQATKEEHVEEL